MIACGSDPDPHTLGACEGWTDNMGNPFTGQCELACMKPSVNTGLKCDTTVQLQCSAFYASNDIEGCCIPDSTPVIRFVECAVQAH